jgi:hypothetical protein
MSPLKRAHGRPSAGWHPCPLRAEFVQECTGGMTTGEAGTSRPSLRNGLTAYAALSSEANSSCLRRFANGSEGRTRSGTFTYTKLSTSNGCQDHTVLPYAISSLVRRGLIAHSFRRPAISSRATPSRPPLPHSTYRDDACSIGYAIISSAPLSGNRLCRSLYLSGHVAPQLSALTLRC